METGHIGRTEGTLDTMSMMNQGTQTENEEDTNNKENYNFNFQVMATIKANQQNRRKDTI